MINKTAQEEIWLSPEWNKGRFGGGSVGIVAYAGNSPLAILRIEKEGDETLLSLDVAHVKWEGQAMGEDQIASDIEQAASQFEQTAQAVRKLQAEWKPTYDKFLTDNPGIQTQAAKTSLREFVRLSCLKHK